MPDRFDFDSWVKDVRDPAAQNREGWRTFETARARASYEIAPLPGGRFALRMKLEYECGNVSSYGSPWTAFGTREECLAHFLEVASSHFAGRHIARGQAEAATRMRALLAEPFREPRAEPVVDEGAPEQQRAEAARKAERAKLADQFPLFRGQIEDE